MPSLALILRDLLILRRGPQDLPYSPLFAAVLALFSVFVSQLATLQLSPQQQDLLVPVTVAVALQLGVLYLLLHAWQRQARFVQTATAGLCVDVLFTAAMLPLLPVLEPLSRREVTPEAVTGGVALAALLFLALGLWRIVVDAHILRSALDIRLLPALLINMARSIAIQIVLGALFGIAEGN